MMCLICNLLWFLCGLILGSALIAFRDRKDVEKLEQDLERLERKMGIKP